MDYSIIEQDLEEVPNGEIYFIFMKDDDEKCKIGKSDNPKKRTAQLQTGNPYKLYIYKTLKGYAGLEKMLHAYFKKNRIRKTEWFNITFDDVDDIFEQYNELKETKIQILEKEEKDYILDEEPTNESEIELIEETETTVIKKKIYQTKKSVSSFICEKCERKFTQERYLQAHLKRKAGCDTKFVCPKCNRTFSNTHNLQSHLNRVTSCVLEEIPVIDVTKDENKCQFCNKTYASAYSLKRHQSEVCSKNKSKLDHLISLVMELKEENALLNSRFVTKQNTEK